MEQAAKEKRRVKQREYSRRYYLKMKNDPDFIAKGKASSKEYYKSIKDGIDFKEDKRLKQKQYRQSNTEKCRDACLRNYYSNRKQILSQSKRQRDNIDDVYLLKLICQKSSLKHEDIPRELVELKKTQIQLYRELKGI